LHNTVTHGLYYQGITRVFQYPVVTDENPRTNFQRDSKERRVTDENRRKNIYRSSCLPRFQLTKLESLVEESLEASDVHQGAQELLLMTGRGRGRERFFGRWCRWATRVMRR